MKRIMYILTLQLTLISAAQGNKLVTRYVEDYVMIAKSEMRSSGIPASIKLAQGILESDMGRSDLATKANNHFGIKCGKDWYGNTFYKLDDEVDSLGNTIPSCFRSFDFPAQSFAAHSIFLTNPKKKSRYGFLFDLPTTDYVGWANGLRFSGYATDPNYSSKIIKIIEAYRLFQYDELIAKISPIETIEIATSAPTNSTFSDTKYRKINNYENLKNNQSVVTKTEKKNLPKTPSKNYLVERINDVEMVTTSGGETLMEIASNRKLDPYDLLSFNEAITSPNQVLDKNEIIYISRKKKSSEKRWHIVSNNESVYDIAQKSGVRLQSILVMNNLKDGAIVNAGEKVSLAKHLSKSDTPKHHYLTKFDQFIDMGRTK